MRAVRGQKIQFNGELVANVSALNHDSSARRIFRLYRSESQYVAERIDDPNTSNVRYWGAECKTVMDIYDFFGNEPLANYLYGSAGFNVPGLVNNFVGEESAI